MARKKKLYLVWQSSGSYDTYYNRLCGIFDDEEKALALKAKLDENVVRPDDCWTVMPQEVYCQWPTIELDEYGNGDFEFASEYEGYTREQRDEQEERWYAMTEEYGEAEIREVYMNDEL